MTYYTTIEKLSRSSEKCALMLDQNSIVFIAGIMLLYILLNCFVVHMFKRHDPEARAVLAVTVSTILGCGLFLFTYLHVPHMVVACTPRVLAF